MEKNEVKFTSSQIDKIVFKGILQDIKESDIVYKAINILSLLQHNYYVDILERVEIERSKTTFIEAFRRIIRKYNWDHAIKLFLNVFITKRNSTKIKKRIILVVDSFVPHILDGFIEILKCASDISQYLILSDDKRSVIYIQERIKIDVCYISFRDYPFRKTFNMLKEYVKLAKRFNRNKNQYFNQISEILAITKEGFQSITKFSLLASMIYIDLVENVLSKYKDGKILMGCDAFSFTRVISLLAKQNNIDSFVLQHGAISGYNGYVPVIADKIFVWSICEKKLLIKCGTDLNKILVTGSPKFKGRGTKRRKDKKINILYICSPISYEDISRGIEKLKEISSNLPCEFVLWYRPHPHFKQFIKKLYLEQLIKYPNIILDNRKLSEALEDTDIAFTFEGVSSLLLQAKYYGIPSFLCEAESDKEILESYSLRNYSVLELLNAIKNINNPYIETYYKNESTYNGNTNSAKIIGDILEA